MNLGSPPLPFRQIELDLPTKIKVGLSASNISAKAYHATFENFALLNDETQIESMFGDAEIPKEKDKSSESE